MGEQGLPLNPTATTKYRLMIADGLRGSIAIGSNGCSDYSSAAMGELMGKEGVV
jgi:hypothetical protein